MASYDRQPLLFHSQLGQEQSQLNYAIDREENFSEVVFYYRLPFAILWLLGHLVVFVRGSLIWNARATRDDNDMCQDKTIRSAAENLHRKEDQLHVAVIRTYAIEYNNERTNE